MSITAIIGSTATGKTALSVALAGQCQAEIISVDSRLVYQGLDIGTAKPTLAERQGITHHAIDCVTPDCAYTVSHYLETVEPLLKDTPKNWILTGGTGFYLKALFHPNSVSHIAPQASFRQLCQAQSNEALYAQLLQQDPARAQALYPQDRMRIIRALEIIHVSGKPASLAASIHPTPPAHIQWIGLTVEDPDWLRKRIKARVQDMVKTGWIDEVQQLVRIYGAQAHALQITHGYPEWLQYLQGELSYDDAFERICIQVQQYARRQRTWFYKYPGGRSTQTAPNIRWFCVDTTPMAEILRQVS